MSEHHYHSHHHRDGASLFKEKSLKAIKQRHKLEKWLKIIMTFIAAIMVLAVVVVYVLE